MMDHQWMRCRPGERLFAVVRVGRMGDECELAYKPARQRIPMPVAASLGLFIGLGT